MNLIKPDKLKKHDTIGILAISGAVTEKEHILQAETFFKNNGYKVLLSKNIFDKDRYLAGKDEDKISELHNFFSNPEIKAIICMRGGYGAIRLINKIDYNLIRNNPKIFCGYSDITALSAMILKHSGLMTYSGPMAQGDFGTKNPDEATINSFFDAINSDEIIYRPDEIKIYNGGEAKGLIWGGNLSTVVSLCGQDFLPEDDFIFFTEDLNEPVYKIDKMINQLINIKQFAKHCKGIALGYFLDVDNEQWLDELFIEIGNNLNIPVIGGFRITHSKSKITIPYGASATLKENCLHLIK